MIVKNLSMLCAIFFKLDSVGQTLDLGTDIQTNRHFSRTTFLDSGDPKPDIPERKLKMGCTINILTHLCKQPIFKKVKTNFQFYHYSNFYSQKVIQFRQCLPNNIIMLTTQTSLITSVAVRCCYSVQPYGTTCKTL